MTGSSVRKCDHVTWKCIAGGRSVLLDLNSGRYYSLNEAATKIWQLLGPDVPVNEVGVRMARDFDGAAGDINADVREMVALLKEKGFVEVSDEAVRSTSASTERPSEDTPAMRSAAGRPYQKPVVREHEPLQQVTAGSSGGYSSTSYYTVTYYYPN